jgi:hypothetical protein
MAAEHFVYLYRDRHGNPIYVGRGKDTTRSTVHRGKSGHNEELTRKLASEKQHTLTIAGPFGSLEAANMVETALISLLDQTPSIKRKGCLFNKHPGTSDYRFRKLAVPP